MVMTVMMALQPLVGRKRQSARGLAGERIVMQVLCNNVNFNKIKCDKTADVASFV